MTSLSERQLKKLLSSKFGAVSTSNGSNGVELIVDCPFCDHRKLSVNPAKGVWHCWHCGEAGTVSRLLGQRVRVEAEKPRPKPRARSCEAPGELVPLAELPDEHEAALYVRNRGFDPKYLSEQFGLCYCRKGRKYADGMFDTTGTIVIPVVENGREIAWQSRLLYNPDKVREGEEAAYGWKWDGEKGKWKKPPKYFTAPGFLKGEHLFNFDQARGCGFVVVTEGAFDAMRVGRCAVATFGTGIKDDQVQILRDNWPLVVLLLDPDAEDKQATLRQRVEGTTVFGGSGSSGVRCVSVRLEGYKDAGECPAEEVRRQIVVAAINEGVDLRRYSRGNPF